MCHLLKAANTENERKLLKYTIKVKLNIYGYLFINNGICSTAYYLGELRSVEATELSTYEILLMILHNITFLPSIV